MSLGNIFEGVRIIELAQYVFVPGATVLMADHGAEVIKVEIPGVGDPYRSLRIGDGREVGSINLAMEQNNRGKKSIALDLKSEAGREALLKLVETADVFITSLRPKAISALRLDVEDLRERNPQIIYTRGNGLGFKGSEANKPGFDASAFWARGGMCHTMTRPGNAATSPRPALGDHIGSMALAFGISGALFRRQMTGEAAVVETSLLSTAVWVLSSDVTYSQVPGYQTHSDSGPRLPLMHTYYTRDDRMVQLMLLNPQPYWPSLCQLLDLPQLVEDPRFSSNELRMENAESLVNILQERIGSKNWAEWQPQFEAWDAPWELVRTIEEIPEDPQVLANDMTFPLEVQGNLLNLVSGPTAFNGHARPVHAKGSPALGADTDNLLREVGYSVDEITSMRADGTVS